MLQSSGSFCFSEITQTLKSEKWKYFSDYDVYLINVFRMSHTLKTNLTNFFYVQEDLKFKTIES